MATYFGGKNGAGVWQTIINQMPPHELYVEPFCGSAAVARRVRPAVFGTILIDLDHEAVAALEARRSELPAKTAIVNGCGIHWLERFSPSNPRACYVYCDPPYLHSTRRDLSHGYRFEMTDADHDRLLKRLVKLECLVAISGYRSPLYDRRLRGWRRIDYTAQSRGGPRVESLWMNYPPPVELHDTRWLGRNFREREKLRRQQRRWVARLEAMTSHERQALLFAIRELSARTE